MTSQSNITLTLTIKGIIFGPRIPNPNTTAAHRRKERLSAVLALRLGLLDTSLYINQLHSGQGEGTVRITFHMQKLKTWAPAECSTSGINVFTIL